MPQETSIQDWLRSKLKARGHGVKAKLAAHIGVDESAISRMLSRTGKPRRITAEELIAIEDFFGERMPVAPQDGKGFAVSRQTGNLEFLPVTRHVQVHGEVAAGVWQEEETWDEERYDSVPIVPGRFERLDQRAFYVRGPSMDQKDIFDGDFVITVKYFELREHPVDGDIVVITRTRAGLCERTVKQVAVFPDRIELWPRSSDARYQTPIVVMRDRDPDDDTTVEITDMVIGKYRPLV